jgi:hypothetical protein
MPSSPDGQHQTFDSPERRAQLAAADIIFAADPVERTCTVLYGQEMMEDIDRSGTSRHAAVVTVNVDSASDELDQLDALVREIKGHSSFRPADLFPEFVIDAASFRSDQDLLDPVRLAVDEIRSQHRRLLPPVQLRFYYSVKAAGFTTANEELQEAAQRAKKPVGYLYTILTLGHLLYRRLPAGLIKPTRCLDIVHGVAERGNMLGVRCRSLLARTTPRGPAYHSRRMPRMRFGADKRERLVAFSKHALERIYERTVYDWRDFAGHGDAFAFLDNCVYFEDCTAVRGEPSFVVYNACVPHFHSWRYFEHVLGQKSPSTADGYGDIAREIACHRFYYLVGYCPVSFHGDIALATTMLFPGMNRRKGTPEGGLIERSGLPAAEIDRMKARVESQLSMKAIVDSGDFSLVKWFHDNGVPQVVRIDKEVFKYD